MAQTAATSPGTMADDATVGTVAWTNPNNAKVSDGVYAVANSIVDDPIIVENSIKIIKSDGTIGTTNKSTGATLPTTDTYISYGSSSDLWDDTWTAEDINDVDFGMVFSVRAPGAAITHYLKATNFGFSIPSGAIINGILIEVEQKRGTSGFNNRASVDHIRITVYYTEAAGATGNMFAVF